MGCSQSASADNSAPQALNTSATQPPAPKSVVPPPPTSAPQQQSNVPAAPAATATPAAPKPAAPKPPPPPTASAPGTSPSSTSNIQVRDGDNVANFVNTENPAAKANISQKSIVQKIQPLVGFVVKTMNILDNNELEKMFLNILHHESVTTYCSYACEGSSKRTIFNVVIPSKLYFECENDSNLKINISCQAIEHINEQYHTKADASQCVVLRSKLGYLSQ